MKGYQDNTGEISKLNIKLEYLPYSQMSDETIQKNNNTNLFPGVSMGI